MTSLIFPNDEDERLVLYNGFCMSVEKLDYFFSDCDMTNINMDEIRNACRAMYVKSLKIKKQFVKLQIRDVEAAFLAGSLYYDELDDIERISSETELQMKTIRREIFDNMVEVYGTDEAIPRYAHIMKFVSDINVSLGKV